MRILDLPGFLDLVLRFILNLGVGMILLRWLYYSTAKRKDYLFTYILISSTVFLLCYLLESVKLQIGFALGLFAIFGIIRYRTNAIPIKEMTYLFIVIGISVINALSGKTIQLANLLFANQAVISTTFLLEKVWLLKHESSKTILYDKINLIKPENHNELIKDLSSRTGIRNINRIELGKIDFFRDLCELTIYYYSDSGQITEGLSGAENQIEDDDDD
ncbi:MAG: DUF4956 domain-containing protein [Bacteroidales bacterium]|nr:DUF4956 domain-containing protein [Bacteroidales bacterium]